ncbi:MAG TPA: hypothetical protein HA306_10540 [Methanosarcina sp.]|nr:hypothetical protein [Methanosarcina sp.]
MKPRVAAAGVLLFIVFFTGGCLEQDVGTKPEIGNLAINVTIGPLCPVEPCEISEAQKENIYSARTVRIYTEDGKRLVGEFSPDPEGRIIAELEAGTYIVAMKPLGIDSTSDLPVELRVLSGETTYLNISIDTGIR